MPYVWLVIIVGLAGLLVFRFYFKSSLEIFPGQLGLRGEQLKIFLDERGGILFRFFLFAIIWMVGFVLSFIQFLRTMKFVRADQPD